MNDILYSFIPIRFHHINRNGIDGTFIIRYISFCQVWLSSFISNLSNYVYSRVEVLLNLYYSWTE